jgi:hypothetical protein
MFVNTDKCNGYLIKTYIYVRQICDEFFLEKETFPIEFVKKINKGVICLNIPLLKMVSFVR